MVSSPFEWQARRSYQMLSGLEPNETDELWTISLGLHVRQVRDFSVIFDKDFDYLIEYLPAR